MVSWWQLRGGSISADDDCFSLAEADDYRQKRAGGWVGAAAMLVGFIDDNRPGSVDLVILR